MSYRMTGMRVPRWTIIVPVKRLSIGKSRLRGRGIGDDLVLAIALDTISAVLAAEPVDRVIVVTSDPTMTEHASALGAKVVADEPDAGLNAAIRHGEASAGTGTGRAALTADLPALRPAEVAGALHASAVRPAYVADHLGTGTTMVTAPPGVPLDPHFGAGSAAAHAASGALGLAGRWPGLRLDVDTPADLEAARTLGLGPRTRSSVAGMQGTVASYDPVTRDGTVLLDDGSQITFPAAAFDASGLRLLRFGQRIRIERDDHGQVAAIALVTM